MPNSRWIRGNKPRAVVQFTSTSGVGVDPVSLIFKWRDADNAEHKYTYGLNAELVKDATGLYHVDVPLDTELTSAKYYCRWEARDALGVCQGAAEIIFESISDYVEQL